MKLLENKTAIVTNAVGEIGEAIALKLASNSANIAFTFDNAKNLKKAKALEAKLIGMGVQAKAYLTEKNTAATFETMVNDVLKAFGQIDICINNFDDKSKDILLTNMSAEKWNNAINENLNGVFMMTKLVMRPMMKAKTGSIINMSSIVGEMGSAGRSSTSATQAGVIGFTKSTARELGRKNIRCNAIAQGIVESTITNHFANENEAEEFKKHIPLGRFANIDDIANSVLLLTCDMANYITGQVISVCGGLNM